MQILYKADDGTIFTSEEKCINYEIGLRFPELFSIDLFDDFNNKYHFNKSNLFDENAYWICEKIHIYDNAQLMALHWLAKQCGWCEFYDQIDSSGLWIRTTEGLDGIWKKEGEL